MKRKCYRPSMKIQNNSFGTIAQAVLLNAGNYSKGFLLYLSIQTSKFMEAISVTRDNERILISIPASINTEYIEQLLDYLKVKAIASHSQATEDEIIGLADEINTSWWKNNKQNFIK